MHFHDIITASRQEHALTQEEVAERTGVSIRQLRRWETGTSVPSGPRIAPLAKALELSVGELSELCNAPSAVREHGRRVGAVARSTGADEVRRDESMIRYRIRWGIEVHDIRPRDLADALDISVRRISRWLAGTTELGWREQCAVANYLDLPVWWLHTSFSDGCDLLGWSADDIASDRADAAKLRRTMRFPDGWSFTQDTVDRDMVERIARAHGLPADDIRRVAYPLTCTPGSQLRIERPYSAAAAITRALRDNTAGIPFEPRLRLESMAAILAVDSSTITRWATGTTEIKPTKAARLAFLLGVRSWTLWLPPQRSIES